MKHKNKFTMYLGLIITVLYFFIMFIHATMPKSNINKYLSTQPLLAHFYAFPLLIGSTAALISILIRVIILYKNGVEHYRKNTIAILQCFIILLAGLLSVFTCDLKKNSIEFNNEKTFKIVEWNAFNSLDEETASLIFKEYDADIAVFPELGGYNKGEPVEVRIKDIFININLEVDDYQIFSSKEVEGNIAPVTIITKKGSTTYSYNEQDPITFFGTVYLNSNDKLPGIIGVHTAPPLPGLMNIWKRDLNCIAADITVNHPDSIIIGDFNATLRHGDLNNIDTHEDALIYLPRFERGTWKTDLPVCFRTAIDHILLPKEKYRVKNIEVIDLPGSDHAAIFTEIIL